MNRIESRHLGGFLLLAIATGGPMTGSASAAAAPAQHAEKDKAAEAARQKVREAEAEARALEAKRARAQAEAKEKERAGRVPEEPRSATQAAVKPSPRDAESDREIARKAAHFAQIHRVRQARIDRLIRIYKAKGDTAKVAKLEALRAKEDKRTQNAIEGFRKRLGEENWGRVNSELQKHHGRDEHAGRREGAKEEKPREGHAGEKAPNKAGGGR